MTVLDCLTRSLRLLGALSSGDGVPTAQEAQDALTALNGMVDAWATERLTCYTSARQIFNVLAGKQVYLIGPTASSPDWTAARPEYIDGAGLILTNSDPTQTIERPLEMLRTDEDWKRIVVKGVQSSIPLKLYYQADYPNGSIALWPAPNASSQVALYTPTAVSQFTSLTQTLSLPPGYQRALIYNLAIEMAPEFGAQLSEAVVAIAQESKANIKRPNVKLNKLRADIGLQSHGRFDWMIGEER